MAEHLTRDAIWDLIDRGPVQPTSPIEMIEGIRCITANDKKICESLQDQPAYSVPFHNPCHEDDGPRFIQYAELQPGHKVIDLGTGGGLTALLAHRQVGASGRVWTLDRNPLAIGQAEASFRAAGLAPQSITTIVADIRDIGSPPPPLRSVLQQGPFDRILCQWTLQLLPPDKVAGYLSAWAKHLKPGGRIVADIQCPSELTYAAVLPCQVIPGEDTRRDGGGAAPPKPPRFIEFRLTRAVALEQTRQHVRGLAAGAGLSLVGEIPSAYVGDPTDDRRLDQWIESARPAKRRGKAIMENEREWWLRTSVADILESLTAGGETIQLKHEFMKAVAVLAAFERKAV